MVGAEKLKGTFELNSKGGRSWSKRKRTPGQGTGWSNPQQGLLLGIYFGAGEGGKSQNVRGIGA